MFSHIATPLTIADGSYYYFNRDGGWYFCDRPFEDPEELGAAMYDPPGPATYVTPGGEVIERISATQESNPKCRYVVGICWSCRDERIYWDNGTGYFVRTFRKDIVDTEQLDRLFLASAMESERTQLLFQVDEKGVYHGSDTRLLKAIHFQHCPEQQRRGLPRRRRMTPSVNISQVGYQMQTESPKTSSDSAKVEPVTYDPLSDHPGWWELTDAERWSRLGVGMDLVPTD